MASRKVPMTNKVVGDRLRHSECLSDKSRFVKQKHKK